MPDQTQVLPPSLRASADHAEAVAYVRDFQKDGRLLLRHVARHADRAVGASVGMGGERPKLHLLTEDPNVIVDTAGLVQELTSCVDVLSREAAPASARTIRLTRAYLNVAAEGGEPPPEVVNRVKSLRLIMRLIVCIAVVSVIGSVLMLAHVDSGRRAAQQLQRVVEDLHSTFKDLRSIPEATWVILQDSKEPVSAAAELAYLPFCEREVRSDGATAHWRVPAAKGDMTARAQELCGQLGAAKVRERLAFTQITIWNCVTQRPWLVLSGGCIPSDDEQKKITDWNRTEIRTNNSVSLMAGFVLPLLLGCVGGCAFVLRRLDQKLSNYTLEVRDGSQGLLRVLLATMLGGLLGVVWSGDKPVEVGGFTLSLAAAAFFVGFALEAVFTVIEAMVDGVTGKMRGGAQPPAAGPNGGLP